MPRSRSPRLIAVLVSLLLILSACTSTHPEGASSSQIVARLPGGATASGRAPNFVFVLTDDLSTNLLQYMPHVQALARRGTSFSNYYVVDSLCCPSRTAIFTGQYPHDDGVYTNHGADGGFGAFTRHGDATKTFAYALQDAGYRTALMGKYLNDYHPVDGQQPGWSEWDVAGNGYPEYNYVLNQNGIEAGYGHQPKDYLTTVLSDRADSLIAKQRRGSPPFALEVATFAPHRPATPAPSDVHAFPGLRAPRDASYGTLPTDAPPWLQKLPPLSPRDNRTIDRVFRLRVQAVQAVDRMVGRLERRLAAEGLDKNTYFVFSSDNGFHTGSHRLMPGKQTAFDTDIRVPLIVAGPGVPAGRTVGAMASSIDLAPTFEALAGVRQAGRPDGVSLAGLWHGDAPPTGWQQAVLVEHHGPDFDSRDPDVQPIRSGDPPTYEAMRTPSALYVEYDNGEREYYDLTRDPLELHNLASRAPPAVIAALHDRVRAMVGCHGATACQVAAR